jgi:hypothetical protein
MFRINCNVLSTGLQIDCEKSVRPMNTGMEYSLEQAKPKERKRLVEFWTNEKTKNRQKMYDCTSKREKQKVI